MFTLDPGLPNEEISPFSEVEDEVLCNQPHKDDEEETEPISLITFVHHTTYHYTCIILKNLILKILNTTIAWITKKSNIRWRRSLKRSVFITKQEV